MASWAAYCAGKLFLWNSGCCAGAHGSRYARESFELAASLTCMRGQLLGATEGMNDKNSCPTSEHDHCGQRLEEASTSGHDHLQVPVKDGTRGLCKYVTVQRADEHLGGGLLPTVVFQQRASTRLSSQNPDVSSMAHVPYHSQLHKALPNLSLGTQQAYRQTPYTIFPPFLIESRSMTTTSTTGPTPPRGPSPSSRTSASKWVPSSVAEAQNNNHRDRRGNGENAAPRPSSPTYMQRNNGNGPIRSAHAPTLSGKQQQQQQPLPPAEHERSSVEAAGPGKSAKSADASSDERKINTAITAPFVRIVDSDGGHKVVSRYEAIRESRSQGLDLVEFDGSSDPPVCKIMDYSKFRYNQKKKEKDNRKKAVEKRRSDVIKEVRISSRTEERDMEFKVEMGMKMLEKGHRVKFGVIMKKGDTVPQATDLCNKLVDMVKDVGKLEWGPKQAGHRLDVMVRPLTVGGSSKAPAEKGQARGKAAEGEDDSEAEAVAG